MNGSSRADRKSPRISGRGSPFASLAFRMPARAGSIDGGISVNGPRPSRSGRPGEPWERPAWVAVVYLDWETARAPIPDTVIRAAGCESRIARASSSIPGTNRGGPASIRTWVGTWTEVRETGRFIALAGSLDEATIRRLRPLQPEVFAVRGTACHGGDRHAVHRPGAGRTARRGGLRSRITGLRLLCPSGLSRFRTGRPGPGGARCRS